MADEQKAPVPAAVSELKQAVEGDVKKEEVKVVAAVEAKKTSLWQRFVAWLAKV